MQPAQISGIPTDRDGLVEHMARHKIGNEVPVPEVTEDHVAVTCATCGRECWIGPKQAALRARTRNRTSVTCYFCIIDQLAAGRFMALFEAGDG